MDMNTPNSCPVCGTPYGKRLRCYQCTSAPKNRVSQTCLTCGKSFEKKLSDISRGKGKYCSQSCAMKPRTGTLAPAWKGGVLPQPTGYIKITIPGLGTVSEHRHVMEEHLGRKLLSTEQVHHINGNRADNRIENLIVVTYKEHAQFHLVRTKRLNGRWSFRHEQCLECGTVERKHQAHGLCWSCYLKTRR
jgi:hypothetical protein